MASVLAIGLTALGTIGASAQVQGLAGSYLAARQAGIQNDYSAAADYFVRALARDASNTLLMEQSITALVGVGRFELPWVFHGRKGRKSG